MSPHPPPAGLRTPRVVVIGAGVGGLSAAALLAHAGLAVQVLERAAAPGGKMRQVPLGTTTMPCTTPPLDGGPTVLTMRWVFDELFDRIGQSFEQHVPLQRCEVLARHAWGPGETLDLHASLAQSVAAITAFSGAAEAQRYRAFCARAAAVYRTLDRPFMRSSRPNPASLAWRVLRQQGLPGLAQLLRISPFTTLWRELGHYFHDPRLQQLFGRYATYCGSSPFTAPATLMLVAHVEREAVWQVQGGMHRLALALAAAAQQQGAHLRYGCEVSRVLLDQGRVSGVALASGEVLPADHVVFNGDAQALGQGLLGAEVQSALGGPAPAQPSLSALTWHFEAEVPPGAFALSHHNVFFGPPTGYRAEFETIAQGRLPRNPTVYLCAQDRHGALHGPTPRGPERLMALVNAPPMGKGGGSNTAPTPQEIAECEQQMWNQLRRSGLPLQPRTPPVLTQPRHFGQLFPGSAGALYGPASRGWQASFFARPDGPTRVPGLVLAGGSVHPGPGVPMAALSGQLAAEQILKGLASTSHSVPALTPGGMPTP
jgi:1-hydroxycarotenoid 3,4-desaturase